MSYATLQTLIDRYGEQVLIQLTDRGLVAGGVVVEATVTRALTDADAMINGYLAAKYALPLSETPALVIDLSAKIAWWNLHPYEPDAKAKADYDMAMRTLRDIAAGTVRLPIASGLDAPGTGTTGATVSDRERLLTSDNLRGFI